MYFICSVKIKQFQWLDILVLSLLPFQLNVDKQLLEITHVPSSCYTSYFLCKDLLYLFLFEREFTERGEKKKWKDEKGEKEKGGREVDR